MRLGFMMYGSVAAGESGVYWSVFCRWRPFSNRNKHKSSKSCHHNTFWGKNTTGCIVKRVQCVGQVDVFGVVLMNSRVGKEQVTVAMAALISKQRETYKPITCPSTRSVHNVFLLCRRKKSLCFIVRIQRTNRTLWNTVGRCFSARVEGCLEWSKPIS